jgi:hypothetical protein
MFWSFWVSSSREAAQRTCQLLDTYIDPPGFCAEDSDHNFESSSGQIGLEGLDLYPAHLDGACSTVVVVE